MKDFKSFSGSSDKGKDGRADWQSEAQRIAESYNGKSEGDMMKEILARAEEGKRNGTLSNEQIDAFYKQFAPSLDPVKRKKLQKIVEELKRM